MILADSVDEDHSKRLSGVNLIYLAPEYFYGTSNCNWKVDVWSIGAILYLLITGGVSEKTKTHEETFDFREPIWYNIKDYMLDFVKRMMQARPDDRDSIDDLLEHKFI